jgi:hypothetical protein
MQAGVFSMKVAVCPDAYQARMPRHAKRIKPDRAASFVTLFQQKCCGPLIGAPDGTGNRQRIAGEEEILGQQPAALSPTLTGPR